MKKYSFLIMLFCLPKFWAQETTVTAGGNALGSGGTVSYSIGQVTCSNQIGSTGFVTEGVQQPFEILTLTGQEFTSITLEAILFPNPTKSIAKLIIRNYPIENLNYQLFDMQGKFILEDEISSEETVIDLDRFASATYVLQLNTKNKSIKTFKIIKN